MKHTPRRDEWRRTKDGRWTRSLGERGLRIRLFEKRSGGGFYRAIWLPIESRWDRKALGTTDRAEADRLARALLGALLSGSQDRETDRPILLGELWDRYSTTAPRFLDNKELTRRDAAARAALLMAHFGKALDVRTLTEHDVAEYTAKRLAGGIVYRDRAGVKRVSPRTRPASPRGDLIVLWAMLQWAMTVRTPSGKRWLSEHPLFGVSRPTEPNPRRPVATFERFVQTRDAMRQLGRLATRARERQLWVRMELALVLAEATGRRLGSIRQLRWDDIDFEKSTIRWRAEADKKGCEYIIPVPTTLLEQLRQFRRQLSAVGGWVFAGERRPDRPMDRHLFDKWLTFSEREAKIEKLRGGLWHPYRRKWATERKHLSIKDVAAAGGWKDTETLITCYQQPDQDTLLKVMSEPRKLRDKAM